MFRVVDKICYNKDQGYSILLVLVIVGAIAVAIATSLLLVGANLSKNSLLLQQSYQARHLTNACAEEALQQMKGSLPFVGYGSLNFSLGTCGYFVTNTGGQTRNIQASSTVGVVVRKLEIDVTKIKPQIILSSWQEVADF
ncbi:MAG: hypothetical protein WCS88_01330 [Patescibacteria group bacterium]|jgi:hypothetical protein